MAVYDKLIDLLKGHRVIIQTHNFPDPDAIGTAFGLHCFLKNFDVDSILVYDGKIEKVSTIRMIEQLEIPIIDVNTLNDLKEEDYVVTVDGQKFNSNFTDIVGEEVACIDHHIWTTSYEYKYIDHRLYGACSTIITDYFIESGIEMPQNVATALLYGVKMDTFSFSRGVTEEDIKAFAYLHPIADNQKIRDLENNNVELKDLRAYGVAFENTVVYDNVGVAHITFDCPDPLIAMVSDFILSLDAVEISIIYANRNGGYKFSVRSEGHDINAGKLISKALKGIGTGGGHATMAGGVIFKERTELLGTDHEYSIIKRFLDVINEMYEKNNDNKKIEFIRE